jgi:Txe/YoeB family toxin of Txe-Axe toxin-antitoxin module
MKKFVSYEKMSKKEQKKINDAQRRSWNGLDPVTRVVPDEKKAYKRRPKHRSSLYEE